MPANQQVMRVKIRLATGKATWLSVDVFRYNQTISLRIIIYVAPCLGSSDLFSSYPAVYI